MKNPEIVNILLYPCRESPILFKNVCIYILDSVLAAEALYYVFIYLWYSFIDLFSIL